MEHRIIWLSALLPALVCGCGGSATQPAPAQAEATARDSSAAQRTAMVEHQMKALGRDISNKRVLKAMNAVPRHEFVPAHLKSHAYDDSPLPIGHDQTISQPFIVAFMTQALDPQPNETVLEIGTGSGYQAAVLGELVKEVYSIEIVEPLAEQATETLDRLGYTNVHVRAGDGYQGWSENAPYDAVIVTCAPDHIPQPLVDQLKEGGKMIIPVGTLPHQELILLQKKGGQVRQRSVLPVRFVPMTGEARER